MAQSSVLSTGSWFKVGVTESGVYRLNFETLSSLGMNPGSLDPSEIKIYGNAVGGMLPQANDEDRPEDLLENAISIAGVEDGSFDNGDYILFYAVGPDKMEWDSAGFEYEKNIYSDTAYYFITHSAGTGSRVLDNESEAGTGTLVSDYNDAIIFEEESINILRSGRTWYGPILGSGETFNRTYEIPGITSDIEINFKAASQSSDLNSYSISIGASTIGTINMQTIPSGEGSTYSIKARSTNTTLTIPQTSELDLSILYQSNAGNARALIDNYTLAFERDLTFSDEQLHFRSISDLGESKTYQVNSNSNPVIWNVTDPINASNQLYNKASNTITFTSQANEVEEFVAFNESDISTPFLFGSVENQSLRGDVSYDGIIVSHPLFQSEATRLANFHATNDGLRIKIVSPFQIYNEFSSGRQDIVAIRDYLRHVYQSGGQLKYLLLFGDCSFDYKYRTNSNSNFVPTYESVNSVHPIFSHSSDDFYGFFEEDEGDWLESESGDHTMEIGIGRLPARSVNDAQKMVDKIIYYSTSPNTLGPWRNQIAYLGDDGDSNIHVEDIELLSELIDTTYAEYRIDKLLLDAFQQEVGATRESSTEATRALKTTIKEGVFTLNFLGHGDEVQWMDEQVLNVSLIEGLNNRNKMPIFVTATCEFGRYDDPFQVSGAELLLLNENGGAIALLTTSRPVFASKNFRLNEAFHRNIFRQVDGEYQRLGEIIRVTKNEGLAGAVNRNFTLLGDPMMMPAYPQMKVEVNEFQSTTDTLSALEEVTLTGQVIDNGVVDETFNGIVDVVILDEKQDFETRGQQSEPFTYSLRTNAIYRGEASVTSGRFSFNFVVPKTISYQFQQGKMSLYAWDEDQNKDAIGSSRSFVIGGTNPVAASDFNAPSVKLYLNDESFRNGGTVASSSILFAEISDENGITAAGNGLVQGISLDLNGTTISLNQFYSSKLDTYQEGMVVFPLQDLAVGSYTARLTVFDTHNNQSSEEITFKVVDGNFISLFSEAVYPNPVRTQTTFRFEHDREEEDLEVTLIMYSGGGDVVYRNRFDFDSSNRLIELPWNATTNTGLPLRRGIYFYRMIVRSKFDGAVKEIANKLVIDN